VLIKQNHAYKTGTNNDHLTVTRVSLENFNYADKWERYTYITENLASDKRKAYMA
jgi:hypothetical protein